MKNVWKPREESKWFCLFLLVIRFLSGKRFCQYNLSHFFIFICETGGGKKMFLFFTPIFAEKAEKENGFSIAKFFLPFCFHVGKQKKVTQ